jgi:hypothetical protein
VGQAELTHALAAVRRLPISVANAHVESRALAVPVASVGALAVGHHGQAREQDEQYQDHLIACALCVVYESWGYKIGVEEASHRGLLLKA